MGRRAVTIAVFGSLASERFLPIGKVVLHLRLQLRQVLVFARFKLTGRHKHGIAKVRPLNLAYMRGFPRFWLHRVG